MSTDRSTDWTRCAAIALSGALALACGEESCGKGGKCDGCWDCSMRDDGQQPGQITGKELVRAVSGTWQGRYTGKRYGESVDVRVTIEAEEDGTTTYGVVTADHDPECTLPADADARCASVETTAARINVMTEPASYGFDGEWLTLGGSTLREQGVTKTEVEAGGVPNGVPSFAQESDPENPSLGFILSPDDTLWMAPNVEDVHESEPFEKIGARVVD